jgi:hypothetical protein
MIARMASDSSPASPVNARPCPCCPSSRIYSCLRLLQQPYPMLVHWGYYRILLCRLQSGNSKIECTWTLMHPVSTLNVFGKTYWYLIWFPGLWCRLHSDYSSPIIEFDFLCWEERTIIAYDMDRRKVHVIPSCVIWYGRCSILTEFMSRHYYIPYVPLILDSILEE